MSTFHLGIDVAKAKLDCALRLKDGKVHNKVIANTTEGFEQLHAWLVKQQANDSHICMEATGIYWEEVAQFFASREFKVSVVNPVQHKPMVNRV